MAEYALIHPERPLRRAAVAVAVALCVHLGAFGLVRIWALGLLDAARKVEAERPKEVALATIDAARWEQNRTVETKGFVPSAAFDNAPSHLAKPEHARFLSDKDRRAERETVAAPAPGMPGRSAAAAEQAERRAEPPAPAPGPDGYGPRPEEKGPDLRPRPLANLPLAMDFSARGEGGVPDIDGVSVGGLTVLNAEAWRYATFFDRVGETLYGVWRIEFFPRPPPMSVTARPRGGLARVALAVSLDSSGRAVAVTVRRSSGLPDVDALLAELVRNSAPFPNVPPGLLDERKQYSDTWILALVWGRPGP
jgi:TonB family protein